MVAKHRAEIVEPLETNRHGDAAPFERLHDPQRIGMDVAHWAGHEYRAAIDCRDLVGPQAVAGHPPRSQVDEVSVDHRKLADHLGPVGLDRPGEGPSQVALCEIELEFGVVVAVDRAVRDETGVFLTDPRIEVRSDHGAKRGVASGVVVQAFVRQGNIDVVGIGLEKVDQGRIDHRIVGAENDDGTRNRLARGRRH